MNSSATVAPRRRRWLRKTLLALALSVVAFCTWLYFAHAWVFFVGPGDGGELLALPITVVAGTGEPGFADGRGVAAQLAKPIRLIPYGTDAVVFADIDNHAIRLARPDGTVETLAGGPDRRGHEDGPAAVARFDAPHGVAARADGVIAVCEASGCTIRLLTPAPDGGGFTVGTLAGTPGESGFRDGPCAEALFDAPHAVAWAPGGALLVADIGNGRIRRIEGGVVETLVGGPEDEGADPSLKWPMDLALAPDGTLWILDAGRARIRRWRADSGLSSPFAELELAMPHGVAVLPDGRVAVAELYGHRVLRLDPASGAPATLCGTTEAGAAEGKLRKPAAVLAHAGRLWIADLGNHRIVTVPLDGGR